MTDLQNPSPENTPERTPLCVGRGKNSSRLTQTYQLSELITLLNASLEIDSIYAVVEQTDGTVSLYPMGTLEVVFNPLPEGGVFSSFPVLATEATATKELARLKTRKWWQRLFNL